MKAECGQGRRILIVEDYDDARAMYAAYLSFHGYDVVEAASGNEVQHVVQTTAPDLIVMDMALPGMDGWEATQRVKAASHTKHIPVVALTGHATADDEQRAREAGCDGFLEKPCLPDTLVAEIERVLARQAGPTAIDGS